MRLFTQDEARATIDQLNQVEEYKVPLLDVTHGASSGQDLTPEGLIYQQSLVITHTSQGEDVPEFEELGEAPHPHCDRLLARQMARVIAYLRKNGGYQLVTTQELGNCLYASVLRGSDCKKEFVSMHLRRLLLKMIGAYPDFFFKLLSHVVATQYGQDRPSPEEIDRMEREGEISAAQAHDYRLPGPFSFIQYCEHLLTNATWGDEIVLVLISMLWQVTITVLNADTLGEVRVRHNRPMQHADLLVVFIGGDHYMGAG